MTNYKGEEGVGEGRSINNDHIIIYRYVVYINKKKIYIYTYYYFLILNWHPASDQP